EDVETGASIPGNFGALRLNGSGGNVYRNNISGASCDVNIAIGQALDTEPGGMTGPTQQGVSQLCLGTPNVSQGTCPAPQNQIIIPIWDNPGGSGQTTVTVRYVGTFV